MDQSPHSNNSDVTTTIIPFRQIIVCDQSLQLIAPPVNSDGPAVELREAPRVDTGPVSVVSYVCVVCAIGRTSVAPSVRLEP